jgi:2-oxoglutarate dehydrogenase E2 component (dihydrolipoamide succinyltransferase)
MPTDLVVPALGESITEAVISRWLKKVGEAVAVDEPVVDLETDKITVQLPSPKAGVLTEQRFPDGSTVKVGQVVGIVDESASVTTKAPDPTSAKSPPAGAQAKPVEVKEVSAPTSPPATKISPQAEAVPTTTSTKSPTTVPSPPAATASNGPSHPTAGYSPTRRKMIRELGYDPFAVEGGGHAGPLEEVVPMTPLRKKIAERLVQAQHTSASLTTFNEIDLSHVMALRARHQDAFVAKHKLKLGFMSFFAKAVVAALQDYPMLNAEIRGTDIVFKKHYDIGIAVGSGKGLVVPVLRHVDELSFAEVESGIAALAAKAKDNKLTLDELSGGTFTITNGGIYGSMMSTPLLNFPQVGILGMHNIVKRAVVVDDKVEIRPMMYVAVTYDHRLVDGREAVQFLVGVKERVESPEKLLFSI